MKKPFFSAIFFFISFLAFSEEIRLPHLYTYIESTVVEQRQVLTSEEIEETKAEDLPELLTAAGIQLLSYGPYGLMQNPSIRGFTDETVRVVIDGICVNNAQYGTFDFSSINIHNIEKIEIVRGGFTEGVSDEGAVGGVIYITTKKQQLGFHFFSDSMVKTFFNYYLPLDTFSQAGGINCQVSDSSFVKANGKLTFAANRYLYESSSNTLAQRKNAKVLDGNGNVNYLHYFGNGNSISVNELFYGGKKHTPGPENSKTPGVQTDYNNNLTLQLIHPALISGLRMENSLCWLGNIRFYDDAAGHSAHYVNTGKYAGMVDLYKFDHFSQAAGVTFDYTYLNSTDDGIHSQFSGTAKSTTKYVFDGFSFSLPVAIKFCNENFAFTPKIGMGFETDHIKFFCDIYKMTQFPNMDDLYWDSDGFKGNPDLKPENGFGGEITIDVHKVWLPFSICGFTNYYENKIQWAATNGKWQPENIASAFYAGVDFNFEKSFWNEVIQIKGNGEYLYNKLMNKNNPLTYGKKIMWTPDFTGSLTTTLNIPFSEKFPQSQLALEMNYMGKRYTSNLNINYLEPYLLLNLSGEMCLQTKKTEVKPYFRLDNLLNTNYQAVENYPMPGISLTLGCKVNSR